MRLLNRCNASEVGTSEASTREVSKTEVSKTTVQQSDTGAVSLYVAIVFVVFMLMAGLVSDGADIRQARRRLDDLAARISREAAQQINTAELHRNNKAVLDITKAKTVGEGLITRLGLKGEVKTTQERVIVILRETVKPSLSIIAPSQVTARREATVVSSKTTKGGTS